MVLLETQSIYLRRPFLLSARTACQINLGKVAQEAQLHIHLAILRYFCQLCLNQMCCVLLAMGVCVQLQVEKHLGFQKALKICDIKSKCVVSLLSDSRKILGTGSGVKSMFHRLLRGQGQLTIICKPQFLHLFNGEKHCFSSAVCW